jgi:DNA-binding transcriptional MerR regulator
MSRVRDHWSIGEVLALLQDEFPEVTISKIRFLESQGLIDPERTPSGYRKFSDADYDRLFWILEQQRDNYLPLRVIRDRLDEGQEIGPAPRRSELRLGDQIEGDEEDLESVEPDTNSGSDPIPPRAPEGYDPEAGLDGSFSEALADLTGRPAAGDDEPHPVRDESLNALADVMGAGDETGGSVPDGAGEEDESVTNDPNESAAEVPDTAPAEKVEGVTTAAARHDHHAHEGSEPAAADPAVIVMTEPDSDSDTVERPVKKPAPRLLGTRSEGPRPVTKTTAEALAPPPRPTLPGSSVALTGEELAEQSGTTPGMIAELQKYVMISPRRVGGAVLFDSTALTIARLAVQFGRYGLEPRHLKTVRLGAEREVALLTQSIGPTLKANNPETRRRSYETLFDLTELTASLRSIIVRDLVADLEPGG